LLSLGGQLMQLVVIHFVCVVDFGEQVV
jgi:hypothetical protein